MSYFNEIPDYATYSGHEADFHFSYNANSGGGQAFLGGRFYDENGHLTSPETLNGRIVAFKYLFRTENGEEVSVVIDDEKAKYEVKPRGNGSTSMKLGIGTDRVSPSKVVSAFMMLPPTCGVKTPSNLQLSILSANNYWLQSMWLECSTETETPTEAIFIVKDCVFGGGVSKETTDRAGRYFKLNIEKRIADIIALSHKTDAFREEIAMAIKLFADIYLGHRAFNYEECNQATKSLMELLAQDFPDVYSGITDPLSAMHDIVIKQSHANTVDAEDTSVDNEAAFKDWLARLPKANGDLYSENTRKQYISALKSIANQFADTIGPFTSVFEIADVETFKRVASAIKGHATYEEFNRSRGNGSLSAGLDLYRRFLEERNPNDGVEYLSPAWFRLAAEKYVQVDTESNALYQQFQSLYAPEKLRALSDDDLLGYIFLGVNDRSLCNALEFDAQYTQFGSIAGGTAYKYNLFYSRNEETWKTSFGEGGQRSVSQEEALEIGKQIRDALVAGADVIANHETLATVNDYNDLLNELNAVIPQYITKMWFLKYYHMMFPHILPNFYNEAWQKHILCNLNIVPSDAQFIRMGQINAFVNECGISNIVFSKIIFDSIGSPKTFYRIGTGDNGIYFGEWRQNNYIAIGWNELGDLTAAYQEDADSKAIITDALKSQWNYDNRLASRKYGEINSFYSAAADTTYAVAMAGQKILAIGLVTGGYFFDEEKEYGHCRPVRWLKVFEEGKTLPFEGEGKLTTFYELKNSENICYLYSLLHGRDETTVSVTEGENVVAQIRPISFATGLSNDQPRNRILFGAPGTGKSFTLNHEKDALLADGGEYERVTFHPDYSYANFVGTYKPVPCKDSGGKDAITYSYVPGPFMRTYVKALQNSRTDAPKPFLLVIEEINRANVAAVFGDVFQLLDRGDDEVSEYPIQASEDTKKYLARELGGNPDDYAEIRIPDNMFIWATMNSADQGVFPMDTAFKRRWDFTYLGIDDSEAGIVGKKVILGQGDYRRMVEWNVLRKAINDELLTYKVNEDKLMGPYFISKKNLPEGEMIDTAVFTRIFKNKVIMYLFDDAAKQKRITLFGGCDEKAKNQYSKICREFDTKGVYIFCEGISSQFIDNVPEVDGE